MGKGRKVLLLALLALAVVEGGIWWLAADSAGESEASRDATPAVVAAPRLPEVQAENALPEPVAADGAAALAPDHEAEVPPPLAEGEQRAMFSGRVVDHAGRPIAGAVVHHYPSPRKRHGIEAFRNFTGTIDPAQLPHVATDAEGRFRLEVVERPPEARAAVAPAGESGWYAVKEFLPLLLVIHPEFESRIIDCPGWQGGDYAAGDIVLARGASLSGRAVDEDGRPLAGVTVRPPIVGSPTGPREGEWDQMKRLLVSVTDETGRFGFESQWAGPITLELHLAGRRSAIAAATLRVGERTDLGDIVLAAGAVIEGQVVDADGRPVPEARLLVRPAGMLTFDFATADPLWQFTVRFGNFKDTVSDVDGEADEQGFFRFDVLDAAFAPFHVYASAPGFEVLRTPETAPGGEPLVLTLQRAGSILLTIVDPESGAPITDATVTGLRQVMDRDQLVPLQVASGPQALAAAGVPPPYDGLYLLSPAGTKGNTAVVSAPGHTMRGYVLPTVVAPERATFHVKLPPEARATGVVVDGHDQPIAGATVTLVPPGSLRVDLQPVEHTTDAAGHFVAGQLAGGDWSANASAPHFVTSPPQPLALRKGQTAEELRIVLQPAGAIAGVVLQGGQPLAGARVRALSVARAEAVQASKHKVTTTAEGLTSWTLNAHPLPGEYQAVADTQGRFRFDDLEPEAFTLDGPPGVSVVVDVKAGETTEVTLLSRNKPRVRGRVTEAGVPVSDVFVDGSRWIEPHSSWTNGDDQARTDAEGRFDLELDVPGRYRIGARQGTARTNAVELELAWDQTEWQELSFPSGVVRGRVVEAAGGKPVGGATVALADAAKIDGPFRAAGSKRTTYTDADGRFAFERVAAGPFALFAVEDGHVEPPAVRVDVPDGGAPPDVLFTLQRGGIVKGHVAALNGAALPEKLRVRATGLDGQPDVAPAAVKKDGTFQCTQLAPGRWRCELAVDETAPPLQTREATVAAGEVASAEFEVAF